MAPLASDLRNILERVVIDARDAAEAGARAALETLAVHEAKFYPHISRQLQELRNHLRARGRQLGDRQDSSGRLGIEHLVGECAYEHWHRMLFARFLAENGLLIEPQENMAISLAEAKELSKEDGVDVWVFASRCAEKMLPQIFRPDDPLLQVSFAKEHMLKLESLLDSLPTAVFTASDALGWVYQFWQSKKKDEINRSEVKIGADEISAVTQLFTEPYMVAFLLHNTLGAWWAGKRLTAEDAASAKTEDELRGKLALPGVGWEYLRFVRGTDGKGGPWRPAVGTFDGWPKTAAELKVLDDCCGSGHFLVAGLHLLVPIRMAEEGLSAAQAVDAVLRDNLHGLEIDERCCQIAAFALAFAAWTYPEAGGYRPLPNLHIACTGIGPQSTKEQWLRLAEDAAAQGGMPAKRNLFGTEDSLLSASVKGTLEALHELFAQAPVLGSLINPANLRTDLFHAEYKAVAPLLSAVLDAQSTTDETRERAIAAAGMVKAADLLAGVYTLVITNVPYLGRGKQDDILKAHLEEHYRQGKADLATAFVLRCLEFCAKGGSTALVTPQNWLFLTTYTKLREMLLNRREWNLVARLGPGAFETIGGHVVNVALLALSATVPADAHLMAGVDVSGAKQPDEKAALLRGDQPADIALVPQAGQLKNPDARITLDTAARSTPLQEFCICRLGLGTGDAPHYIRAYWETLPGKERWRFFQMAATSAGGAGGLEHVIAWDETERKVLGMTAGERKQAHNQDYRGREAWGRDGQALSVISTLKPSRYTGELFDKSVAVLVPHDGQYLPAIAAFTESAQFLEQVRKLDQKVMVTNATLVKVPFDPAHWKKIAAEKYPNGLSEPESDDPTQWLFHGRPEESTAPLQVAVVRLLGYRWPAELDDKMRLSKRARALVKRCDELAEFADNDGIVCIPSVRGEEPATERLLAQLAVAGIKPAKVRELAGEADLDDWLRNGFFEEHCKLFYDRPFVWHIWDGRKRDGFHALVNYHKLCEAGGKGRKLLESLTYSYLGEWISRQKDGVKRGEGGAEDRLAAAMELQKRLEAILEGEPPFDIFIRWKSLSEQPIGWQPDINDGVRMNIRPFLASDLPAGRTGAGVLRWKPNIKWTKDRGKEPERPKAEYPWFWGWDEKTEGFMGGKTFDGNRWNDCHYTNKTKQQEREKLAAKGAENRRSRTP
jgi:hypothetical protein